MVDAILPAGGRISGAFAEEAGVEVKALIRLGERTVMERTIETLRATGRVGRMVLIGPEEISADPASSSADAVLPATQADSGPTNIMRGLEWLHKSNGGQHSERVVILSTDLPFLTSDAIGGFFDACPPESDVCLPLISREEFEGCYPGSANEFVRLLDGEWTIGCAFLVNPEAVARNRGVIEQVFEARKSQWEMARLLGWGLVARFLAGRLTVDMIQDRCRQILGCSASAVRGCSPLLAFDIDHPEDYRYALDRTADSG